MTAIIHIVDDDEQVRASVALLLQTEGFTTAEYDSAASFLNQLDPERPGCLILDVRMPGLTGLELQEELNRRRIRLPIIFMSGHGNIPTSVKAVKGGAIDFLEKPFDKGVLLTRIREALAADRVTRAQDLSRLETLNLFESLTPREREVMVEVVAGRSNKEIARRLEISHRTVELHRTRMMTKMQAKSLPDLVAKAVECGVYDFSAYKDSEKGQ